MFCLHVCVCVCVNVWLPVVLYPWDKSGCGPSWSVVLTSQINHLQTCPEQHAVYSRVFLFLSTVHQNPGLHYYIMPKYWGWGWERQFVKLLANRPGLWISWWDGVIPKWKYLSEKSVTSLNPFLLIPFSKFQMIKFKMEPYFSFIYPCTSVLALLQLCLYQELLTLSSAQTL